MKGMDLHLATRVQGYPYLWLAWSQYEVLLHNTQTILGDPGLWVDFKPGALPSWLEIDSHLPGLWGWLKTYEWSKKLDDHKKDLRQKLATGSTSSIKITVNSEMHDNSKCTWRVLSKVQFLVLLKSGWRETVALENFLIILIAMMTMWLL